MTKPYLATSKWKKLRLIVLRRDSYTCAYCSDVATEVDHVHPRSKGGSDDIDNLVACCRTCNIRKKDKTDFFLNGNSTPPVFPRHPSPKQSKLVQNGHTQSKPMTDSPFNLGNSPDQSGGN